jgi:exopolysaccharide biosynthesis polyprenyl glycosylphosphotransferase
VAVNNAKLTITDALTLSPAVSEPRPLRLRPAFLVLLAIAVDVLLVLASLTAAQILGSVLQDGPAARLNDPNAGERLVIAAVAVALLASHSLYDLSHPQPWPSRLYSITSSMSIGCVIAIGVSALFAGPFYARAWFAIGWALAIAALAVWHAGIQRHYAALMSAVTPGRRVIVVGANPAGEESARELSERGYQVVGYADNGSDLPETPNLPLLGPIGRLDELVENHAADDLVIALPPDRRAQLSRVLTRGFGRHVRVKYAADLLDVMPRRFNVSWIGAKQYIEFSPAARVNFAKRAIDIALVLVGIVVFLPVFALVAIAIKLDSPGPVLYGQLRIGKDGRSFRMLKFRSMRRDADERLIELLERNEVTGPMFKIRSDPRVTRVGRLLRRYSLDELPQVLNVLRGEMSLVGPRPPIPSEVERYEDWQVGRLRALPGLTGLWQVSGRTEVPFEDMIRLDLHYIRNWSIGLDLEILLRTIPAVFTSRGAY